MKTLINLVHIVKHGSVKKDKNQVNTKFQYKFNLIRNRLGEFLQRTELQVQLAIINIIRDLITNVMDVKTTVLITIAELIVMRQEKNVKKCGRMDYFKRVCCFKSFDKHSAIGLILSLSNIIYQCSGCQRRMFFSVSLCDINRKK